MRLDARWAGPAPIGLGLAGMAAFYLQPAVQRTMLAGWILSNALAYECVLPLAGLGAVLALVSFPQRVAAIACFGLGIALGFFFAESFFSTIGLLPGAITHHFLTGPILSIAVGLCLAVPWRIRGWVLPLASLIGGGMFAAAIRLTDPSFRDPIFAAAGIAVAFWILAAICLTVQAFRQAWFETAGRILGSWLIAIGLLYGGASLIPRRSLVPPPSPQSQLSLPSQNELTGPGPDGPFPDLDRANRPRLPGGFDPFRQ